MESSEVLHKDFSKPSNDVTSVTPKNNSSESASIEQQEVSSLGSQESTASCKLQRSLSFDPKILQRPPSIHSIKSNKSFQLQHSLSFPSVEPIHETGENDKYLPVDLLSIETDQSNEELLNDSVKSILNSYEKNEIANIGGCIECVKAIPVYSADEIEVGDHIVFAGAVYDHHVIIVEKISENTFKIVEATNSFSGAVVGVSKFFGGKAKISSSEKQFDFKTKNIRVVEYRIRLYSKEGVAKRAIAYAEGTKDKTEVFKYDLFENNCEHFATFCVTGQKFSLQVRKFRLTARLFLTSGFIGISDEKKRNDKEFENNIICKECHDMNKKLLGVELIPIQDESDIQIRYTYYNLWHEAVVLDIKVKDKKQKFVLCRIAHYAFCGFLSHRTIKEEDLKVYLDGKSHKLEYKPPVFNVYDPEMVIKRAKERIGEQQFVFFSNDSSHFARWCKLKLVKE